MVKLIKFFLFFLSDIFSFLNVLYRDLWLLKNHYKDTFPTINKKIAILGNGSSLSSFLDSFDKRDEFDVCTVNFSVNSPVFFKIKPQLHVLADPVFYKCIEREDVKQMYEILLTKVDWPLTIYVTPMFPKTFYCTMMSNQNIKVVPFCTTRWNNRLSLWDNFKYSLFDKNIISAGAQNVVVGAIYCSIRIGYKEIYLYGVEHSWLSLTFVGMDNICYLRDEHFYGTRTRPWLDHEGNPLHIHDLMKYWNVAFYSYHILKKYADFKKNVKIINKTKDSFIDAFEKV